MSFNQKYLILQNHFQLDNSYAFLKAILHSKRVTITFYEKPRLNLGNQYHKDATQITPGIKEKFKGPLTNTNITPQQIDETLKERQMKCPKIFEALDRILYLIRILIDGLRKQLQTVIPCETQKKISQKYSFESRKKKNFFSRKFLPNYNGAESIKEKEIMNKLAKEKVRTELKLQAIRYKRQQESIKQINSDMKTFSKF